MGSYEGLAEVYDLLGDDFDYPKWAEYYRALLRRAGVEGGEVLDAGCGTGRMTLELLRLGFRVLGADSSPSMLRVAAEKLRRAGAQAQLICQDMCALRLAHPVDAVVCACDGVNYLLTDERLSAFARAASACIRPGGALAFDISSRYRLETLLGDAFFGEERDQVAYLWENRLDRERHRVMMDITFFVREADGRYRRFVENHVQRAHSVEQVVAALSQAGFAQIEAFGEQTFAAPEPQAQRIHFLARRT